MTLRASWTKRAGVGQRRAAIAILCIAALALCLRGFDATGHPDQMAFQPLFKPGLAPFNPGWFEKPPFHTYFNYFLSVWPIERLSAALSVSGAISTEWQTHWSKILQALLFVASIIAFHRIVGKCMRPKAALALSALFASSAGLIAHAHFLTADIPVLFWMILAFLFCQRIFETGRWRDYVFAGLVTGVATATKYNGIAVGIAIPAAHLARYVLKSQPGPLLAHLLAPRLVAGVGSVVVGFVLANPFAILDFHTFYGDFRYNAIVAPVYEGQTGHSFGRFFMTLTETIGLPALALSAASSLYGLWLSRRSSVHPLQRATVWMAVTVLLLYYAKFAPFPRLETRFVLPIAPYLLIASAPGLDWILARFRFGWAIVAGILAYNIICCWGVGDRFRSDARLAGTAWLRSNVPPRSRVEADIYSSGVGPQYGCCETEMPFVTGRERLFAKLFQDEWIAGSSAYRDQTDRLVAWFSPAALEKRAPSYLVLNSNYFDRFVEAGMRRDLYPSMRRYFCELLHEQLGYAIIYDVTTPDPPVWMYPRDIDFLKNRFIVLARASLPRAAAAASCSG